MEMWISQKSDKMQTDSMIALDVFHERKESIMIKEKEQVLQIAIALFKM